MDLTKLEALKYRELQKVAKELGLKANGNKKDLIQVILEQHEAKQTPEEALEDVEDVPLVPMEDSKLDNTFDIDESKQNVLNETFEKETDEPSKTFDKEEPAKGPRFVEFSAKKGGEKQSRSSGRCSLVSTPASGPRARVVKPVRGRADQGSTPKLDYLTKKNSTPLRGVAKTPGSIQKRETGKKVASNIPRFVEFARTRKPKLGAKMPDFAKMHEKNFKKMESLTDTVTKQLDRAKALTNDHNELVKRMNERKTPGKTPSTKVKAKTPATSKASKTPAKFAPAVLTTAKMSLNFGGGSDGTTAAPFQFSAKPSGVPVVARVAPRPRKDLKATTMAKEKVAAVKERKRSVIRGQDSQDTKAVLGNITNRSVLQAGTPGKGTPGKKFDIKASLARPLAYKPHKGKLAPLGKAKETKGPNSTWEETKQRQMAVIKGVRLNKRAELMMKNRQMD
jgi:hypothetical protein